MKKGFFAPLVVIIVLIIVVFGFIAYQLLSNSQTKKDLTNTNVQTSNPSLAPTNSEDINEFPPLYDKVEWMEPFHEVISFQDSNNETYYLSGTSNWSQSVSPYPDEFISYYEKLMIDNEWNQEWYASGLFGEDYGYKKGDKHIQFGIRVSEPGIQKVYINYN